MARRTIAGLGLLVIFAACAGDIDEGAQTEGLTPAQRLAQDAWLKKALPAFKDGTCNTCHDGSMEPTAPGYLAGTKDLDIRDTIVAFVPSVVNLGSPKVSRVVVKGMHEGPALSAPDASNIIEWLTYEHDARPPTDVIQTTQMAAMMCNGTEGGPDCPLNTIDLSTVGMAGSAGSSISFYATPLGTALYLTQLKVTAGPSGLYLVHPVFETWPMGMTDPTPDPVDPFFNVNMNLAAGASAPIAGGTGTLSNFPSADPVSIRFDELSVKM